MMSVTGLKSSLASYPYLNVENSVSFSIIICVESEVLLEMVRRYPFYAGLMYNNCTEKYDGHTRL